MKRFHQVVKVKPECLETYKKLHEHIWDGAAAMLRECHFTNYSIAYRDGLLFGYFEYTGSDYAADMAKMAEDPATQEWWRVCKPCLQRVESETESDCWANMEQIFYLA